MSFQHGFSDIAQLLNTCNGFSGGKYDRKEAILSQVRYWLTVGSRLCTKLALGKRQPYKVGSPENETRMIAFICETKMTVFFFFLIIP